MSEVKKQVGAEFKPLTIGENDCNDYSGFYQKRGVVVNFGFSDKSKFVQVVVSSYLNRDLVLMRVEFALPTITDIDPFISMLKNTFSVVRCQIASDFKIAPALQEYLEFRCVNCETIDSSAQLFFVRNRPFSSELLQKE